MLRPSQNHLAAVDTNAPAAARLMVLCPQQWNVFSPNYESRSLMAHSFIYMIGSPSQISSFVGAMLILVAYAGQQMKWIDSNKASYNILNAVGSGILAYIAFHPFQIGFVVLESVWALISIYALLRGMKP